MEWKTSYLDVVLVPSALLLIVCYHMWLWHRIQTQPFTTVIGTNSAGRRYWVAAIMRDNEKKNILAVQTLRNTIMGSTLMATTSILLCTGLAAVLSSTYSIKKPIQGDTVYGARGPFMVSLKYVVVLSILASSFLCHSLSIRFIGQVNFLINSAGLAPPPPLTDDDDGDLDGQFGRRPSITTEYVTELLERGIMIGTIGNRLFYSALPVLLWIVGPVPVIIGSVGIVPLLYKLDMVSGGGGGGGGCCGVIGWKRRSNEINGVDF